MHKIVLIEDRRSRMEIYLENGESDVDKLSKLEYLDLYGPDDAKNNISKSDYSFLQKYQLIIAHRSALLETSNTSAINELYEYCKSNKKDLILFSGGIAQSSYFEDGFNVLLINSKVFYHQRLFAFLDDYSNEENEIKLIELKYGKNWRLGYYLSLRELDHLVELDKNEDVSQTKREMRMALGLSAEGLKKLNLDYEIEKIINSL